MPAQLGVRNAQYTPLIAAGTSTISPGNPNGAPAANPGVLYGCNCPLFGTGPAFAMYDIVGTQTNLLMAGTFTAAGQAISAGINSTGVRYRGSLVAVATGTASQINVLWD